MHRHPSLNVLGRNLRRQREKREFTQEKLGELAELDPTYISGIERGTRNPGVKNIARLAKALGVSPAKLMEGARPRTKGGPLRCDSNSSLADTTAAVGPLRSNSAKIRRSTRLRHANQTNENNQNEMLLPG